MSLLRSTLRACLLVTRVHSAADQTRCIQRWVAPTLHELRKRAKKLGPQPEQPRSEHIEWNYRAELFAFGKRLYEDFQLPLLQNAFTQSSYVQREQLRHRELGVEEPELKMNDNTELAAAGLQLAGEYVNGFLEHEFPRLPAEGREAFAAHLLSTTTLAYVASQLGMRELIFAAEYPPSSESLAQSLLAVIGALEQSSGIERVYSFVRDFVCTQLNQRDLLELWNIEEPLAFLSTVCAQRKLGTPEPRLIGDCGKNTVLAAYHVGIYADKQMLGKGFGEDIATASQTAALDALQKLFGIEDSMRPLNFRLQVESKSGAKSIKRN